jgi:hypothetical protein
MECTLVKQFPRLRMWGLSQMTRNGSMRRFACPAPQFFLRKMRGQGARYARRRSRFHLLTPHLALTNSNTAFAKAEPTAKAFRVETIKTNPTAGEVVQSYRTAPCAWSLILSPRRLRQFFQLRIGDGEFGEAPAALAGAEFAKGRACPPEFGFV